MNIMIIILHLKIYNICNIANDLNRAERVVGVGSS